jgi:hypothetical protein
MSATTTALLELAVGIVTAALAIPLWRAGRGWPRFVAVLLVVAGAAALVSAVSTLADS